MFPALTAKNNRGRPNVRHASHECQSGWLRIATRKPSLSSSRPKQRHRKARMIDVCIAGDKHHVDRVPAARVHFVARHRQRWCTAPWARRRPAAAGRLTPRAEAMLVPSTIGSDNSGGLDGRIGRHSYHVRRKNSWPAATDTLASRPAQRTATQSPGIVPYGRPLPANLVWPLVGRFLRRWHC